MDSFEPIRASAAQLHAEIVTSGADALNPTSLVQGAIKQLDLEVFWLPANHPALKGARALLDEQSGSICCETAGEPADRMLLVAHEIGHACMHVGSSVCSSVDIDPSRSIEAAPVGLQRVEDYGASERRELQANVFAREFLFPRSLARHLHMNETMNADAIATRTGLPKSLIRQQLLDALLLPTASTEAPGTSLRAARPDPSQDRAATHRGSPFQLQAGPGTGKTRTLVKRIRSLLAQRIDPGAILVLTYSNRAAGELSERIAAAEPEAAPRIWVGTFHAFGLDLVRRHHDRLDVSPNPSLFDRSDAIAVLEEILPTLPLVHYRNLWDPALVLRDVVVAISRAKDELADPRRYRALAEKMREAATDDEARLAAEKCLEIAHIYDLYEKAIRDRGAVDFGDLIMRPALLLEADAALRFAVQLRHRHVLVDEYQDINRASARLLKAVAGDGKHLWVVGDARQSIYRFRGASSLNMVSFGVDYPGAVVDQLTINYRSTTEIVSTVTAIAPHMSASTGMLRLELTADQGDGPEKPNIRRFETLNDEVEGIAANIRELATNGTRLRDQAVLCRSNARLNEIAVALEARGIPVLHLGSLFERDEVRDLLALLSLAIDRYGDGLARVGTMSRYALSLQDVYVACRFLREANLPPLTGISSAAQVGGPSSDGRAGLTRLARDLDGLTINTSPWEFLTTYILDRTNLARSMADASTVAERMRAVAVWQFLNFVRDRSAAGSGLPIQRVLDRVRQLVLLAEERDLRQVPTSALHLDAVRLMTVHGSKGLEFEAIHVPGLTVSCFPSQYRGPRCPPPVGMIATSEGLTVSDENKRSHDQEEECLFFVAISRARTHLHLYLAKRQLNGNNRNPSPLLNWLPSAIVQEIDSPPTLPLPLNAPRPTSIEVSYPATWLITNSRFSSYEKCPRRYFYTHVLKLGGGRKVTAFTQTHTCLYKAIEWLADARRSGAPSAQEMIAAFESIWQQYGPVDHAFATDYHDLATRLVTTLFQSGADRQFRDAEPLAIDFPNGRVVVEPDEIAELPNGTTVLRRVRTGHKRSDEYDHLDYTLYRLAGQAKFGTACVVEALHLTDGASESVEITAKKMSNRHATSDKMLANIAAGTFPPAIDAVACPRCPHFFICAATPHGPIALA